MTILDFAKEILELSGTKSQIVFKPLPKDDPRCAGRTSRGPAWSWAGNRRSTGTRACARTLEFFKNRMKDGK